MSSYRRVRTRLSTFSKRPSNAVRYAYLDFRKYYTVAPPNTAVLWTGEKPAVFRNDGIGREYNVRKPYLGL